MKFLILFISVIFFGQDDPDQILKEGQSLLRIGSFEEAEKKISLAIEIDKDFHEAYFWRAIVRKSQNDFEGAISDYSTALELYKDPKYYNNLGMTYAFKKEFGLALQNYNSALELDSLYFKAWFNKGALLLEQGNQEQGCECLYKAYYGGIVVAEQVINEKCQN